MSQGSFAAEVAERLLEHETGGRSDAAALAAATGSICLRLHREFARLLGTTGCDLLAARAVSVAAAACTRLAGVRWLPGSPTGLEGLRERLETAAPDEARQACGTLLGAFLALLVNFIGSDLTLRQIRRAWPDLGSAGTDPGTRRERRPEEMT